MANERIKITALVGLGLLLVDTVLRSAFGVHLEPLRDLAIAFLAAAIVGFGFETREFDRKLLEIIGELRATWHHEASDRYRAVITGLYQDESAESKTRLERARIPRYNLQQAKLRNALIALIEATSNLRDKPIKEYTLSIEAVTKLLELSSEAAHAMWKADSGGEWPIKLPASAADLADEVLAEQMRFMRAGDIYIVISDLSSWFPAERLGRFWAASEEAMVRHKVQIKRVFRHCEADRILLPEQAQNVLSAHWAHAEKYKYNGKPLYDVAVSLDTTSGFEHRGLFVCGNQHIGYSPKDGTDLSSLTFSMTDTVREFDRCRKTAWPAYDRAMTYMSWNDVKAAIDQQDPRWWSNFEGPKVSL